MDKATFDKEILKAGVDFRDHCKNSGVNCALFIEYAEDTNLGNHSTELVKMEVHNLYTMGRYVSPVLEAIMDCYERAQAESNPSGSDSSRQPIPFMVVSGSEDN